MDKSVDILTKIRLHSTEKAIPLQASLELTNRCNERCTHCYLDSFVDDPKRVLTLEEWYKVLGELRSAGTLYLILMGGESMLSPHFWDVAQRAGQLGFHTSIITNGLRIHSLEVAQRLKRVGLNHITVSIYSLDPKIHDKMTKVPGSCERTLKAIDHCREAGLEVGVNCLLTKDNIYTVFDIYDWCTERNLEIKVDPNVTSTLNGGLEPTKLRASKEDLRWFFKERLRRWPKSRPKATLEISSSYICNAAKGKCAVTAYGELLPCIEIREPLGSLVHSSFQEVWSTDEALKWREIRVRDLKNPDKYSSFCEHCPGMAKNEIGDHLKVLQYSSDVASIKQEFESESVI